MRGDDGDGEIAPGGGVSSPNKRAHTTDRCGLVERATEADEPGLRTLLREVPVPGAVRLSYEREPDFHAADPALGDRVATLAGRLEPGGPPVAVVQRASRAVFMDGEPVRVGYIGGLRARPDRTVRTLVGQGWTQLRALHDADPVPVTFLAVTAENAQVRRLLALGRGDAPVVTPVADLVTLAFVVRRHPPPEPTAAGAADALRAEIAPPDLFPADALALPGLGPEDDVVVDGAALSLWDPSPARQTVVRGYDGRLGRYRPVVNGALRVMGATPLPDVGQPIRSAFAVRPVWRDADALDTLVGAALGAARARGLAFLLLGLDARDPALPRLQRRLHLAYRSTLLAATWPGDAPPPLSPPIHAEIASY